MDRLDEMRVFIRVAETRSFRRTAEGLGLPRSTVTDVIKRMEARLGVRLLDRTTRMVAPTLDGEAWRKRCLEIIGQVEDAEAAFTGGTAEGRLRIDAHGTLARSYLLPRLPEFLTAHPNLDLVLSEGDRLVDLIAEGVDCVLRVAEPRDSDLIVRRVGVLPEVVAAAPDYLERHGMPRSPNDLEGHRVIAFLSSQSGLPMDLEFSVDGRTVTRSLPATLTTTGAETMVSAARLGLGMIQVPRYHVADDLACGRLVEVLSGYAPPPSPIVALYPRDRQLSPRLRVFLDWARYHSLWRGGFGLIAVGRFLRADEDHETCVERPLAAHLPLTFVAWHPWLALSGTRIYPGFAASPHPARPFSVTWYTPRDTRSNQP